MCLEQLFALHVIKTTLSHAASVVAHVILGLGNTAMRIATGAEFDFHHTHHSARLYFLFFFMQKAIHSVISTGSIQ